MQTDKLPPLRPGGRNPALHPSKLQLLQSNFQQKLGEEKEKKLIALYRQQQQAVLQKARIGSQHDQQSALQTMANNRGGTGLHREHRSAGNLPRNGHLHHVAPGKKTAGVDRSCPLKPVYHRKAFSLNHIFSPGDVEAVKPIGAPRNIPVAPSLPADHPEGSHLQVDRRHPRARIPRDKTSPLDVAHTPDENSSRVNLSGLHWLQGEQRRLAEVEANLAEEIRRKELLLRAKLKRTEEELRRIQIEMEDSDEEEEWEERGKMAQQRRAQERQHDGAPKGHLGSASGRGVPAEPYSSSRHSVQDKQPVDARRKTQVLPLIENNTELHTQSLLNHSSSAPSHFKKHEKASNAGQSQDVPYRYETHVRNQGKHAEPIPLDSRIPQASYEMSNGNCAEERLPQGSGDLSPRRFPLSVEEAPQAEQRPTYNQEGNSQLLPCTLCNRTFAAERLEKHRRVCEKMQNSRRKVFDSSKHRAKGTDLEQYINLKKKSTTPEPKRSTWRQKHEAFVRNVRQASEVQEDLPPPPPTGDNPDYVPCPHCGRRFAPRPAERHIPLCQNLRSRPPPPPPRRRPR
nr:PREDICTED: zinc finger C2HC domain-containing protein 1C [Lepisosteus oculatus]